MRKAAVELEQHSSRDVRQGCGKDEGPRIALGPFTVEGVNRPCDGDCILLLPLLLPALFFGARTYVALAGRISRISLAGCCIHSGGRARLHLAGFHLSGLHFGIGGARSDIAFARRAWGRLRLRRYDSGCSK
jgi:hypothetical protein